MPEQHLLEASPGTQAPAGPQVATPGDNFFQALETERAQRQQGGQPPQSPASPPPAAQPGQQPPQSQDPQQANPEGASRSRSGLNRMRHQRDSAVAELGRFQGRLDAQDQRLGRIEDMLTRLSGGQAPASNGNGAPVSVNDDTRVVSDERLDELVQFVTNREAVQEDPALANRAMLKIIQRAVDGLTDRVRADVSQELSGNVLRLRETDAAIARIKREYGDEAWDDPRSEIRELAEEYYRQKQKKYGDNIRPQDIVDSFQEAARELGYNGQYQPGVQTQPPREAVVSATVPSPNPADMVEGGTQVSIPGISADQMAAAREAVRSGDWREGFRAISRNMYGLPQPRR